MNQEQPKHPLLESHTIWVMLGVAILIDVLEILLDAVLAGWLLIPIPYIVYIPWFWKYGLGPLELWRRRKGTIAGGFAFELVTLGIMPAATYTVARIAFSYRQEQLAAEAKRKKDEAEKAKSQSADSKGDANIAA
jgi:hypothetical protein